MGLIGDFSIEYLTFDKNNLELITVEYSKDIPEGHINFLKAGTKEDIQVFKKIENVETYSNGYMNISSIEIKKTNSIYDVIATYNVYESKESRILNIDSYLRKGVVTMQVSDLDNLQNKLYQILKQTINFVSVIDD